MNAEAQTSEAPIVPKEIFEAIEANRKLELEYRREGSAPGKRTVEPHALYRGGDGRLLLFAFQKEGPSNSGGVPDWRRFAVESLEQLRVSESEFTTREEYDPASRAYSAGLIASVH